MVDGVRGPITVRGFVALNHDQVTGSVHRDRLSVRLDGLRRKVRSKFGFKQAGSDEQTEGFGPRNGRTSFQSFRSILSEVTIGNQTIPESWSYQDQGPWMLERVYLARSFFSEGIRGMFDRGASGNFSDREAIDERSL
jgi:hypothetical protein